MYSKLFKEIIKRSFRIPISATPTDSGDYTTVRQLDSALMSIGFKLSKRTIEYLNRLSHQSILIYSADVLTAVRELVGDHVEHNTYFIDFPNNVPSTVEFWTECIMDALNNEDAAIANNVLNQVMVGTVNLLDLPKYGKYQHSYDDMVANHDQLIASMEDRMTILHLGKTIQREAEGLYHSLAGSTIPLNEEDIVLLQSLAMIHSLHPQPSVIPLRENKAIINKVRLENDKLLLVDTPTDILRLACLLSDGDVTLLEKTKFKSFPRKVRRSLIQALDNIIANAPNKLGDVNQYRERWKRLGERLHVYDYRRYLDAQKVFVVARGDKKVQSIASKIEKAFLEGEIDKSISLLSAFPGLLFRNLDRIIKQANINEIDILVKAIQNCISKVSARIILSVIEQLNNRLAQGSKRIFVNRKGTAWVSNDYRVVLNDMYVRKVTTILNVEISKRIEPIKHLVVDEKILDIVIPLSNKNKADGFSILPRGSVMPITGESLRFFIYWKQKYLCTDYDLSTIMLDKDFEFIDQLSYTNVTSPDGVHSGDITSAEEGASEFIDIDLTKKKGYKYIIPSINIFSGENFIDVDEVFFGFMQRTKKQKGKPFEPKTVKAKFNIRGKGKVALPLVFIKDDNNTWTAKWLNIYLKGMQNMNMIEENRMSTALLVQSIVERKYLCIKYLISILAYKAESFSWYNEKEQETRDNTTFIGVDIPKGLPKSTSVYTANNIQDLLPI